MRHYSCHFQHNVYNLVKFTGKVILIPNMIMETAIPDWEMSSRVLLPRKLFRIRPMMEEMRKVKPITMALSLGFILLSLSWS